MALCSGLLLAQLVGFRNKPHPGRGGPVLLVSGRSDDPRILVSSSLCKDGSSWGPETCGTGAGHESRTFLQADEVARHQCCVYWVVLSFCICLYCFWSVGWDGIASANKWHRVPVPDCKALMFIDVVCLCGPATHSSWRSLMDHIISHQSISTCPHWNQGGKRHWTCYWLELPLLFMYFGYLNWTGQGRRTGPQSRSGVGNTSMAPFQTLFTGLFKHTFFKYKYKINIYIYTYVIYIYIIWFCLIGLFLHSSGARILTGSYSLPFQLCSLCCLTLFGGVHVTTKAEHFSADVQDLFPKHQQCELRAWL